MIKIIIQDLELEKIKSKVKTKDVPDINCTNYSIDNIFIGSKFNEKSTIEFIPHFGGLEKVKEVLDKYVIRYTLKNI